jgi:transposase
MDVIHQRGAALISKKADVKVCIRVPGPGTRRRTEVRTLSSMTGDILAMRNWLMSEQVTLVGMEATGAYWKPIFYLLNLMCSTGCSTPGT